METLGLIIGGADRPASDDGSFDRRNPITGVLATRAAAATVDDAIAAVDAAAAAFPDWSQSSPRTRRDVLSGAADMLTDKMPLLINSMMDETGATKDWAQFNVTFAADMLREAAGLTTQITGEVIPSNRPGTLAMAVRQPAGVVLSMAPWNAPVILGVRALAMPIACGNTVVMKTSEICPRTHRLVVDALNEAGLPAGVLNAISNAHDDAPQIVEALIAQPAVRRVNFTGSTRVGRIIAELTGRYLKPSLLELGGKAPLIVLDDADIDAAVAAAAFGAFMNQGQICMATERVIVDDSLADQFVAALVAKTKTLRAGDPLLGNTALGSVVDASAAQRIGHLIKDATAKGAVLAVGVVIDGAIVHPTVLDRVTPQMRAYGDE
ncbi:MAG: aldehyde dehydrogenase family protein, partial [Paracoccus sp. (in: a-proteobacteria)]|nr:aldehyde dehydrogenase family protein [Paracoccus sp. (in: a-proteobacteria)]